MKRGPRLMLGRAGELWFYVWTAAPIIFRGDQPQAKSRVPGCSGSRLYLYIIPPPRDDASLGDGAVRTG